jgi:hypothetical protein
MSRTHCVAQAGLELAVTFIFQMWQICRCEYPHLAYMVLGMDTRPSCTLVSTLLSGPHSPAQVFTPLIVSFDELKIEVLLYSFDACSFGIMAKEPWSHPMSWSSPRPMLSL